MAYLELYNKDILDAASLGKTTKEFGGVTIDKENYFLRFSQFTAPLTKAVQELSAEVETLKAEIAALKSS